MGTKRGEAQPSRGEAQPSPLLVIPEVEREIEQMLDTARREAEEILKTGRQEAADLVQKERARLAEEEQLAFDERMVEGRENLVKLEERARRTLQLLERRLGARLGRAAEIIVETVLGAES